MIRMRQQINNLDKVVVQIKNSSINDLVTIYLYTLKIRLFRLLAVVN